MDELQARLARGLWTLYEPVHAVTYFAPQAAEAFTAAGLRGFWRGYFAGRAAPLGRVDAAPVNALFGSFAPSMVERALPSVWELVSPAEALVARASGAAAAIGSVLGDRGVADVLAAAECLEQLVPALPVAGRPLAAANAAVGPPDDPYERLWQATSTLREWRGDAHIAAQVTHGVAGLDILVLRCLLDIDRASMQRARGWTDDEWSAAAARLTDRGLIAEGGVSAAGRAVVAAIESATDAASTIDVADVRAAARLLRPIALACAGLLPFPNPIGLVGGWDPDADPDARAVARP